MAKRLVVAAFLIGAVLFILPGCATTDGTKDTQETKDPEFVLRVNCGASEPYTDREGNLWLADQEMASDKKWGARGGETIVRGDLDIADTNSPGIYQAERNNMDGYIFKVPNGKYTIRLHFAETSPEITAQGKRIFSVIINEKIVFKDLDPFNAAGGFQKPVVAIIENVSTTRKELVFEFTKNIQNPQINGIEIISKQLE